MSVLEGSDEHRAAPRVRSLLRATISFLNGSFQLECLVRDISPTGARLAVTTDRTLPEVFELTIPKTGLTRRARLVWQRVGEIGIKFEPDVPAPEPVPEIARLQLRIKQLEAENRQLKIRIAQLTDG